MTLPEARDLCLRYATMLDAAEGDPGREALPLDAAEQLRAAGEAIEARVLEDGRKS